MSPILPELANALVEERLRQAEMRYVTRSAVAKSNRFEVLKLRLLDRLSELTRAPAHATEIDLQ